MMGVGGYGWQVHMDRRCGIWYIFLNGQEVGLKMEGGFYNFLVDVTCNNAIYANDITLNCKCEHASALWQQLDWC